jgi:hypothetical protein
MRTIKAKVSAAASVSSALVLSTTQVIACERTISVPYNLVSNSNTTLWNSSNVNSSCLVLGPVFHQKWTAEANLRFKELAHKDAMDQLTAREWAELDSLSALRREAKFPLSADQILWQRRQNALTEKLLSALKEYVEFHNFSGQEKHS